MKIFMFSWFFSLFPLMLSIDGEGGGGGGEQSTAERALEFLNTPEGDGAAAAAPAAGAQPAAAAAQPAAGAQPVVVEPGKELDAAALAEAAKALQPGAAGAQPAAAAQPAAQVQPPVDEKNWHTVAPVQKFFGDTLGPYATDQQGKPLGQEQLKLVMDDVRAVYEIADGKRSPEELLKIMQQGNKQAFESLVSAGMKLAGWKREGAPAEDPAMAEVRKINERLEAEDKKRQDVQTQEVRRKAHDGFIDAVGKQLDKTYPWLAGANKDLQAQIRNMYALFTSSMINGDRQITERFEQGNFVDADRLFTQFHNQQILFMQAWANALVAAKQGAQNGSPKIPARGATPAPAGTQKKFDPSNYESRTAAAMAELE